MWQKFLESLIPYIIQILAIVVGTALTVLIKQIIGYVNKKKEEIVNKIGIDQYNYIYNVAKSVFFMIEQQFKNISNSSEDKKAEFDNILMKKIPGLTQEDINHFREAVVGEVNISIKKIVDACAPNKDVVGETYMTSGYVRTEDFGTVTDSETISTQTQLLELNIDEPSIVENSQEEVIDESGQ